MTFGVTFARQISFLTFAFFLAAPFSVVFAQAVEGEPKIVITPLKQKNKVKQKNRTISGESETSVEKSIVVDPKVNISLCVLKGNLKVTGWERSEIRVFVSNGSAIGFNVREKNKQNNAVWLKVAGLNTAKNNRVNSEECLSGEEIELDVPRGATVNIKSRTSETTVEAVREIIVENIGGDIFLNNIEQGINASTLQGDVTVENSGGAITLRSGNGNIVAFDVAPSAIGDVFKAKTNSGAITLQQIEHRQTEINSNSGSIKFIGGFKSGGQYNFGTQNGTIWLAIPEKSSFRVNASYGYGAFNSEFSLQNIIKSDASRAQSLTASMGNGDAIVNLTTYHGAIRIRKQ